MSHFDIEVGASFPPLEKNVGSFSKILRNGGLTLKKCRLSLEEN
jgi:hypothetical protein